MKRKAQLQFGETIAILFIFFMLLVVGLIFYVRIKTASVGQDISEYKDVQAVELSQTVAFLPEFQCTEMNVVEPSCFDKYKILAMEKVSQNNFAYYYRDLGNIVVEVQQIYPAGETIVPYNGTPEEFTVASKSHIPISLYDVESEKYIFGVLRITTFG